MTARKSKVQASLSKLQSLIRTTEQLKARQVTALIRHDDLVDELLATEARANKNAQTISDLRVALAERNDAVIGARQHSKTLSQELDEVYRHLQTRNRGVAKAQADAVEATRAAKRAYGIVGVIGALATIGALVHVAMVSGVI